MWEGVWKKKKDIMWEYELKLYLGLWEGAWKMRYKVGGGVENVFRMS